MFFWCNFVLVAEEVHSLEIVLMLVRVGFRVRVRVTVRVSDGGNHVQWISH